ncbi:MAG: hypothetical protein Q9218_006293 [Villophora microphyllina]
MSAANPTQGGTITDPIEKGKGKAVDTPQDEPEQAEEDEDDLQEIDPTNIVGGRTRGKAIDYSKVDPADVPEDDEDEDDDDFEDPEAQHHDAMEE